MTMEVLPYALAVFLLAGTIKGTVGIGLPITAVGILSQFTDPRLAVTLAVLPIVASNIWQVIRSGDVFAAARRYWLFAVTLAIALFATTFFATSVTANMLVLILGLVIVLFATTSLAFTPPYLPEKYDRAGQLAGGVFAGISGGLTAIWAPPMVIYFLSRRLEKDEFVRASGILFLCGSIPLLVGYIQNGLITGEVAKFSAIMIVPTLLGFSIGELIRRRLDAKRFRTAVLVMFLIMGLNLLRRAIFP